jgi:hypothetical protein
MVGQNTTMVGHNMTMDGYNTTVDRHNTIVLSQKHDNAWPKYGDDPAQFKRGRSSHETGRRLIEIYQP